MLLFWVKKVSFIHENLILGVIDQAAIDNGGGFFRVILYRLDAARDEVEVAQDQKSLVVTHIMMIDMIFEACSNHG